MTMSRREALGASALAGAALTTLMAKPGLAQTAAQGAPGKQWWMDEPVRLALLLYNQQQAPVDTDKFVQWLVDMNCNTVLLPTGGIGAYYPTKVPFHTLAPSLPPGRDLVGEILTKCKARGIRVMSRFEWTVHQDPRVLTEHPDWVQRDAEGKVNPWQGTYLMCINGGYMQDHIFKIMGEVLDKYPIDGMFFNGGGQRTIEGRICNCDNCKRLYRAKYNADIPATATAQHSAFIADCARTLMTRIDKFAHGKRSNFNFMVGEDGDSRNAETHSQPIIGSRAFWVYQASETVNRYRTDNPTKMSFNNDAAFLDQLWRYAHRSAPDGEIRAYQNMANGAGPYIFVIGGVDQTDDNAFKGARPAFKFHRDHEDIYVRQENAARVLLLDTPAPPLTEAGDGGFGYRDVDPTGAGSGRVTSVNSPMRGWFRLLSELHVPFALSNDLSWIDKEPNKYDLVVTGRGAPAALDKFLRNGGRVLASGPVKPDLNIPPVVRTWPRKELVSAYWRVRDHALFPSLKGTDHLLLYGDYLELQPSGNAALTLIPTSNTNPMEKVGTDRVDTTKPGIHMADYGSGRLVYLPWDFGDLYYRFSSVGHAALGSDLIDHLMPKGRQIVTNAHPTVQITMHQQKARGRTNLHFVNLSGESQTAYHAAIPMTGIQVEVAGNFNSARMASMGRDLPLRKVGGYTSFTLPSLDTYDVVVLT
jgi:hypothetical protein